MKKISLSIKTKLVLILIAISTSVVLAVTYFSFNSNIQQEKNSFIKNSVIQAKLLADFTVSALVFEDEEGANENLNKLKNDADIQRAIIFGNKNKIFAQYNPFNFITPKDIEQKIFLDTKNQGFLNFGILKISLELKHQDIVYGTLYIEKSTRLITKLLKEIFNDVIVFTIILLILIYFISIALSNYLLKPIIDLAETSESIASSQNYSTRVMYNSKNEIGILYNSFNLLLKDTEKLTNNLEKQVDIRTNELNLKTIELEKSLNDLKQTQQQLIESEKMSALGNLVSGIAHEVNTPLGNAITSSSIISKETSLIIEEFEKGTLTRSNMEKKLNILNKSAELLTKTLNYASGLIKSFKQISIDQVTNDIRVFKIRAYLEEIFLTNHNKLKLIPVEIEIIGDEDLEINTSPGVIAQIFNNLIQNSIIHAFEDHEKYRNNAKISVTLKTQDQQLVIEYKDNGKGINDEIKETVFEPFVTTKRNAGGTGLGLNIVYNLVNQKLKGSINVSSKKNQETIFIIHIPLNHSLKGEK